VVCVAVLRVWVCAWVVCVASTCTREGRAVHRLLFRERCVKDAAYADASQSVANFELPINLSLY